MELTEGGEPWSKGLSTFSTDGKLLPIEYRPAKKKNLNNSTQKYVCLIDIRQF